MYVQTSDCFSADFSTLGEYPVEEVPSEEVRVSKKFRWKKEEWQILAVRLFSGGLILDVARELPYYHLKNRLSIYEKKKNEERHSPLENLLLEKYNPFYFCPQGHLLVEGSCLDPIRSEVIIWNPFEMSYSWAACHVSRKKLLDHYEMSDAAGWQIFRMYFKSDQLSFYNQKLTLMMDAPDELVPGPILKVEEAGDSIIFKNPITQKPENLIVTVLENGVIEQVFKSQSPVKYPANYVVLHYRFQPDIKTNRYCIMDCRMSDAPVAAHGQCSILDTREDICEEDRTADPRFSKKTLQDYLAENENHTAYSSLTHYPRLVTEWQYVAIRKERKRIRVELN